jgi:hypothetical protein
MCNQRRKTPIPGIYILIEPQEASPPPDAVYNKVHKATFLLSRFSTDISCSSVMHIRNHSPYHIINREESTQTLQLALAFFFFSFLQPRRPFHYPSSYMNSSRFLFFCSTPLRRSGNCNRLSSRKFNQAHSDFHSPPISSRPLHHLPLYQPSAQPESRFGPHAGSLVSPVLG